MLSLLVLLTGAAAAPLVAKTDSKVPPSSDFTIRFDKRVPLTEGRRQVRQEQLHHAREVAARANGLELPSKRWIYTADLNGPASASEYSLVVSVGTSDYQNISVIADTGSSDLWFPTSDFQCINITGTPEPQSTCFFGPNYFNTESPGFSRLDFKNNFNISYGDLEYVVGSGANDTVSVAGLSVPGTEFGIVNKAYWVGDNYTNGLLGLANPLLTSIFYGSDPTVDSANNSAEYKPWFYMAADQGLVEPWFSLALDRPTLLEEEGNYTVIEGLGSITFGGCPTNVNLTDVAVTVPNVVFPAEVDGVMSNQTAYYTVPVDSFNFPGSEMMDTETPLVILDSGTTLIYLPNNVSEAFNSQWNPPAMYNDTQAAYVVDCNATAPWFTVTIGGETFTTTPADLVYPGEEIGTCISSIVPGGANLTDVFILGDRFLVNVVATFNIYNNDIYIKQRQNYTAM